MNEKILNTVKTYFMFTILDIPIMYLCGYVPTM